MSTTRCTPATEAAARRACQGVPYRYRRWMAQGGMGMIVEAEHIELEKPVVLKFLLPELVARPELAERLRREAQDLARMSHPNLVAVLDLGKNAHGQPYLVMERLEGRTLKEERRARPAMSPLEAIELVCQALDGLEHAHRAGLVHRDVKPDNLFVCNARNGGRQTVKLLDFGVAKNLLRELEGANKYPTAEGTIVGTPSFLSPEQSQSQPVDARTDVYGMGVVLYWLLCGRYPFVYDKPVRDEQDRAHWYLFLLQAHAQVVPAPPSHWAPERGIPAALDGAVLRALEKRPVDRHASAAAFAEALRGIARTWVPLAHAPTEPVAPPAPPAPAPSAVAERGTLRMMVPVPASDDPPDAPTAVWRPTARRADGAASSPVDWSAMQRTPAGPPRTLQRWAALYALLVLGSLSLVVVLLLVASRVGR